MNRKELKAKRQATLESINNLFIKASGENREFTAAEKLEMMKYERELKETEAQLRELNIEEGHTENLEHRAAVIKAEQFREILASKEQREITLNAPSEAIKTNIESSGAIALNIHDIIPTLNEGLGLPVGLSIVTGVKGNELWPVSVDDVEMEEVGEIEALSDQDLSFDKIQPQSHRVGLTLSVSNHAIANVAFDVMGFIQTKFTLALKKYLAKKIFSFAKWDGNNGPFSDKRTTAGTITLGTDAFKNILLKVAEFANAGYELGNICFAFDAVTEAELKATPKANGQGGFVIENGKCAGYDYVVSHYVNTDLDDDKKLTPTKDAKGNIERYFQIGCFNWFALQSHDAPTLTIDGKSKEVAKKNVTAVVFNSFWSMTDLSQKLSESAFKAYKIA